MEGEICLLDTCTSPGRRGDSQRLLGCFNGADGFARALFRTGFREPTKIDSVWYCDVYLELSRNSGCARKIVVPAPLWCIRRGTATKFPPCSIWLESDNESFHYKESQQRLKHTKHIFPVMGSRTVAISAVDDHTGHLVAGLLLSDFQFLSKLNSFMISLWLLIDAKISRNFV